MTNYVPSQHIHTRILVENCYKYEFYTVHVMGKKKMLHFDTKGQTFYVNNNLKVQYSGMYCRTPPSIFVKTIYKCVSSCVIFLGFFFCSDAVGCACSLKYVSLCQGPMTAMRKRPDPISLAHKCQRQEDSLHQRQPIILLHNHHCDETHCLSMIHLDELSLHLTTTALNLLTPIFSQTCRRTRTVCQYNTFVPVVSACLPFF